MPRDSHAVLKAWAMLLATVVLVGLFARPAGSAVVTVRARLIGP